MSPVPAPPPISPKKDDRPPSTPADAPVPRSPPSSRSNDVKPIDSHQSRESPPPTSSPPKPSTSEPFPPSSPRPKEPEPPQPSHQDDDEPSPDGEGDIMDMETFSQLIDLDDDDPEFSKGMVWEFFQQAETTFEELDAAFESRDLSTLSSLGHYLKGSSAALGVARVQASCEKIQHYGQLRDEEADRALSNDEALSLIQNMLKQVKKEYATAEKWLRNYYKENGPGSEDS
ncbi:transferase [Coprinopsis cinerea okayama7|uniref:Transferase n=1 Tax=Coprinopsis cinerea (strain Okayama-7 / 130 / ATCC MYA-4618 / FGSC 9003) TaxID=240176 RepID=D6RP70_COPC7|nr:transferase [Coprinopsis cinerea okayama7\|eukprot:XP_002910687.1 transferase [Coprinopsis cinerea okayama7\